VIGQGEKTAKVSTGQSLRRKTVRKKQLKRGRGSAYCNRKKKNSGIKEKGVTWGSTVDKEVDNKTATGNGVELLIHREKETWVQNDRGKRASGMGSSYYASPRIPRMVPRRGGVWFDAKKKGEKGTMKKGSKSNKKRDLLDQLGETKTKTPTAEIAGGGSLGSRGRKSAW